MYVLPAAPPAWLALTATRREADPQLVRPGVPDDDPADDDPDNDVLPEDDDFTAAAPPGAAAAECELVEAQAESRPAATAIIAIGAARRTRARALTAGIGGIVSIRLSPQRS
jgi:hypothetical protein